jgi:hypothetical protein
MENFVTLGETSAGRRLAFVFTVRGARLRFVTAYSMTPQQQESYDEG